MRNFSPLLNPPLPTIMLSFSHKNFRSFDVSPNYESHNYEGICLEERNIQLILCSWPFGYSLQKFLILIIIVFLNPREISCLQRTLCSLLIILLIIIIWHPQKVILYFSLASRHWPLGLPPTTVEEYNITIHHVLQNKGSDSTKHNNYSIGHITHITHLTSNGTFLVFTSYQLPKTTVFDLKTDTLALCSLFT